MLCLIPARGGSQRIPGKNIRSFKGTPIVGLAITTALDSGLFDRVIVSTDHVETGRIASEFGASLHIRPAWLAENDVGTQEVAKEAFTDLEPQDTYSCVLYPCSPLMSVGDLLLGYETLRRWDKDYCFAVDEDGTHAGTYYFGKTSAFLEGRPLEDSYVTVPVPVDRVMDINTEADWEEAEILFDQLQEVDFSYTEYRRFE